MGYSRENILVSIFGVYLSFVTGANAGASARWGTGLEDVAAPALRSPLCPGHRES